MKLCMETLIWLNEYDLEQAVTVEERLDLKYSFMLPLAEILDVWKEKKLKLDVRMDENLNLFAPVRSFTLAISHIVDNACKYSPEGGEISIHLFAASPECVKCTVTDQGPGIPFELQEVVFDRFLQVSVNEELPENFGMGLGLFVARSFARGHGGDVHILPSTRGCSVELSIKNQIPSTDLAAGPGGEAISLFHQDS